MTTLVGHLGGTEIVQQVEACIGCQECLLACPSIVEPISVNDLNRQTLSGYISLPVAYFARSCTQCGACVNVCPIGLRRDTMMLWLKARLLQCKKERKPLHQFLWPKQKTTPMPILCK